MFLKKVFYFHQGYIHLIEDTVKTIILLQLFTILMYADLVDSKILSIKCSISTSRGTPK